MAELTVFGFNIYAYLLTVVKSISTLTIRSSPFAAFSGPIQMNVSDFDVRQQ